MSETIYIKGLGIKKKTFQDGGDVINVSMNANTFIEEVKKYTNDAGYVNFTFKNRKEADDKGNNMYCVLDTFKPKAKDHF